MDTQAQIEKGSDLFEIHQQFLVEQKNMYENISRLETLYGKLENLSEEKQLSSEQKLADAPRRPGLVTELYEDARVLRNCNKRTQDLLTKLEKLI